MPIPPIAPSPLTPGLAALNPIPPEAAAAPSRAARLVHRTLGWIALGLTAVAFFPLLKQHLRQLFQGGEYQHAPLLLAAVACLYWLRWPGRDEVLAADPRRPFGLLLGLIGLFAAIGLNSPPLAMLAAVPMAYAGIRWISRSPDLRRFLGPSLLLLLLVPLPYFVQMELVQVLKGWTTRFAGLILDLLGVNHTILGFTLAVPGKWFFVDDACSGVNSLYGMVALAMVLAVWWRLSLPVTISIIPATLVGVLAVNVIRLTVIVAAFAWYGIDLASSPQHERFGWMLLPLNVLLVAGLASWTQWLLAPIGVHGDSPLTELWDRVWQGNELHTEDLEPTEVPLGEPLLVTIPDAESPLGLRSIWDWLPFAVFAGAAWLGQIQLQRMHAHAADNLRLPLQLQAETLPAAFDRWKFAEFQSIERKQQDPQGQNSRVWTYRDTEADRQLTISVDFPFPGWHELSYCYRALGWEVLERKVTGGQGKPFVVRATLRDGTGASG